MCMLCFRHAFAFPTGAADTRTLLEKAAQLKEDIRLAEAEISAARGSSKEPCPVTVQRLRQMRQEQFDLAKKL